MSEELKPCPFCGGGVELVVNKYFSGHGGDYCEGGYIKCHNCDISMERIHSDPTKCWNTRQEESK
jgi:hypothetical protein